LTIYDRNAPYDVEPGKLYGFGSSYPTVYVPFGDYVDPDTGNHTYSGSSTWGVGLSSRKSALLGDPNGTYNLVEATYKTGTGAYDNRIRLRDFIAGPSDGNFELRWIPTGTHKVLRTTFAVDTTDANGVFYAAGTTIPWDTYSGNVLAQQADAVGSSIFFTVTPEPVTMLLLGIPAVFLRRRRRA
jgi:hypothetical protein